MKKLRRIFAALLVLTLLAGMSSFALAEDKPAFKFRTKQATLKGAQTITHSFTLPKKAATLKVTVKITSNITGEESDVDIYRLKYEVLNPAGKRIGSQVALDALEGKTSSTQTFSNVAAGTVKVKIITNSAAANMIYTVSVSGEYAISLNKSKAVLLTGRTLSLYSNNAGGLTKTWSSSNTGVATVNSSGVVTAVGPGTAKITLTAGSQTATCAITVYGLQAISGTYYPNSTYQMKTIGTTSADTITWTSADPSVAIISTTGKVTAVKVGSSKITAKIKSAIDGKTYSFSRTFLVRKNPYPKTMKVVGGSLALRKSPSKSGVLIQYYPTGTKVTVKSITNGWAKVTIGTKNGYMMATYLSNK